MRKLQEIIFGCELPIVMLMHPAAVASARQQWTRGSEAR
jgi:hypothetical protein